MNKEKSFETLIREWSEKHEGKTHQELLEVFGLESEKEFDACGNLIGQTSYKNGLKNGVKKEYDEKGRVYIETSYKNDVKDGVEREYIYSDNDSSRYILFETSYQNDLKNGIAKGYDEERNLISECFYKNDLKEGVGKYYANLWHFGKRIIRRYYTLIIPYKKDAKHGVARMYCNDELQVSMPYKNDVLHGTIKLYYKDKVYLKLKVSEGVPKVGKYASGEFLNEEGMKRLLYYLPVEAIPYRDMRHWRYERVKEKYIKEK